MRYKANNSQRNSTEGKLNLGASIQLRKVITEKDPHWGGLHKKRENEEE